MEGLPPPNPPLLSPPPDLYMAFLKTNTLRLKTINYFVTFSDISSHPTPSPSAPHPTPIASNLRRQNIVLESFHRMKFDIHPCLPCLRPSTEKQEIFNFISYQIKTKTRLQASRSPPSPQFLATSPFSRYQLPLHRLSKYIRGRSH